MKDTFTTAEIREYFEGWDWSHMKSAVLHNALHMLEDDQDGIVTHFERKKYHATKLLDYHSLLKKSEIMLWRLQEEKKTKELLSEAADLSDTIANFFREN